MSRIGWVGILTCFALTVSAHAQDSGLGEIIVTAQRADIDDDADKVPAIALRRTADFAVQAVRVIGDTRDEAKRQEEIYSMLRGAILLATKSQDIELAIGDVVLQPLTLANYRDVSLKGAGRADTGQVNFLVKTSLKAGGDSKAALDRITRFIKAVPAVGRAELEAVDDLTLSVVRPDQYRAAIIQLVAEDANATAAKLGPDYGVEAQGLDRPVEWARAGLTDVLLYLPYKYSVVPKRR